MTREICEMKNNSRSRITCSNGRNQSSAALPDARRRSLISSSLCVRVDQLKRVSEIKAPSRAHHDFVREQSAAAASRQNRTEKQFTKCRRV